ncbi:MAG TPA: pilus assembly protein PilM, partial [Phycisphaerae bacterium]|nr:pilus assembly protein PilM [Phycisphaerae bacterium]
MLSLVQNWFAPRANPIGVDFGSDCLRLAQVQLSGNEYRLLAAASADVPNHVRHDPQARLAFFVETVRDLLAQSNFHGRQAVLALPASSMHIQHLRLAKMDENETKKALPWEARGKLPIDPSLALLRHLIAGEVYQDQEPKNEVIVMAAARDFINQLLASAVKARLDVIGMNVEPKAVVDCFGHVYRRKTDAEVTSCFLDIGATASRAFIARCGHIFFARVIPIGGDHFNKAVAHALRISLEQAKLLRIQLCAADPASETRREKVAMSTPEPAEVAAAPVEEAFPLLAAGLGASRQETAVAAAPAVAVTTPAAAVDELAAAVSLENELAQKSRIVEQACREPLSRLIEELDLCRRYYESTFPSKPLDRIIFVGGEARQRGLCQHIAREMGLAAQVGDPLVRMGRISEVGIESGIDRRQPQPGWAVAIGCSLGPTRAEKDGA